MGIVLSYSIVVRRKLNVALSVICLFLSLFIGNSGVSASAAKLGAKCSNFGQSLSYKLGNVQKKLVCKKNKEGKLIWQSLNVPKKTIKAEINPVNRNDTQELPAAKSKEIRTSIALVDQELGDLELVAHLSLLKNYVAANTIKTKINFGPTTSSANGEKYLSSLIFAAKLFANYWDSSEEITIALAEYQDFEWMHGYWVTFRDYPEHITMMSEQWKQIGSKCNQGGAIFDDRPLFWGCLSSDTPDISSVGVMKFAPHEFFHLIQTNLFRKNGGQFADMPTFFNEGAADFFGISAAIGSGDVVSGWQQKWKYAWASGVSTATLKTFDQAKWKELINDTSGKYSELVGHNYYSGAYGVQRLVAAEGVDRYFKFMADSARTHDWKSAFKLNYSISFEDFSEMIARELVQKTKLLQ